MLRKVALEEQKKVQRLTGREKVEAEERLRDLTRRIEQLSVGKTAREEQSREDDRRRRGNEVHLDMTEEEMLAWRQARGQQNNEEEEPERPCAVCNRPTKRTTTTAETTSYFCSADCQRIGWPSHLERTRLDEKRRDKDRLAALERDRQDRQWDRETAEKLKTNTGIEVDFLGVPRGACQQTGCEGYVQQRGAPRSIPASKGQDAVWAWNRVDHLSCRRCGAPSELHVNLSEEIRTRNRTARATSSKPRSKSRLAPTPSSASSSEYYYATRNVKPTDPAHLPRRIDDDVVVDIVGGRVVESSVRQ